MDPFSTPDPFSKSATLPSKVLDELLPGYHTIMHSVYHVDEWALILELCVGPTYTVFIFSLRFLVPGNVGKFRFFL